MKGKTAKGISVGVFIASVILLPGCNWFGGGEEKIPTKKSDKGFDVVTDGSETIVSMAGQPIVTKASLEKEYEQLIKDNPQIAQMLPLMGGKDQLMRRLVNALTERQIVKRYIVENNIDQNPAYKAELDRMINSVKDMLNVKYFNQQHPVTVSDEQVKEFYDKNKETMPDLLVSRGGVRAMGVKFNSKEKAHEFLNKVKAEKGDIKKAAAPDKLKVEDFKVVNEQSVGLSPELRDKISAMKTPATDVVQLDDKTVWVIRASEKEKPVYHEFAKVKDHLKKYLEDQDREKMLKGVMDNLKKKYNVDVQEQSMPAPAPAPKAKMTENEQKNKQETVAQTKQANQSAQQATQTV